jgi:MOSC domain-containing protein YiiM
LLKYGVAELQSINQGSDGNRASHRSLAELEAGLRAMPAASKDCGRLRLIVCRHSPGMHEALQQVRLSVEEGVPGDEWNRRPPRHPDAQLTVIAHPVAELIANGQPLTLSGDNLVVELDISAANLPVGTRLRVGEAIVEMTPKPHNGCAKFQARFGADALRFVQAPTTRHRNLRGVYWKVVEPGMAEVDAPIQVLSRPKAVDGIEGTKALEAP